MTLSLEPEVTSLLTATVRLSTVPSTMIREDTATDLVLQKCYDSSFKIDKIMP